MERFAQKELKEWYFKKNRKPLLLRGARQVGKSTLVKLFAGENNLELHEINLERHLYLEEVFKTQDLTLILDELQGLTGEIKDTQRALLFLDEIQAVPSSIQTLRYFYEDRNDIAIIGAGSLLEFTLADHNFSMPVGRISYYHLGPMSFREYLLARDPELFRYFEKLTLKKIVPLSFHQRFLRYQREYMFVGGMPEAVKTYIETQSADEVQDIHRSILDTYIDDFAKYAKKSELVRLQKIFRSIPLVQGEKIKYSNVSINDKSAGVRSAIDLLCKAAVCTKVFHSNCSGVPLGAGRSENVYKLIFVDIGLMNNLLGLTWNHIRNMDERKLLNEGAEAEQFIGQQLLVIEGGNKNPELYYWLREGRKNNAEVDYVITHNAEIIPVEVKAGKSGSLKSLHRFMFLKKSSIAVRFDLNLPSRQLIEISVNDKDNNYHRISFPLLSLPLYMVEKLHKFLEIEE